MVAEISSTSPDPTPFGPFFDLLTWEYGFDISMADRLRVARFVSDSGDLHDLNSLRLALGSLLIRHPDQRPAFFEAFDKGFGNSLDSDLSSISSQDIRPWLTELRTLVQNKPEQTPPEIPETTEDSAPKEAIPVPFDDIDQPRPAVRERTGLSTLRVIPWPATLDRPRPQLPPDEPLSLPPIDPEHPELARLDLSKIGCQSRPLLNGPTVSALSDALGYFVSALPSPNLDVRTSINRTVESGVPTLCFQRWREVCRVLILEDLSGERHDWNTTPQELLAGLASRGIPVSYGTFHFSPESFYDSDGKHVRLEDLDAVREELIILVFSTGAGLRITGERRILEDLARWPRVAWLDPREEQFWDSGTEWVRRTGLPVFEATARGLLRVAELLIGERGRTPLSRTARPPVSKIEDILGREALPWACACALLPRISPSLAESLRQEFFAEGSSAVPVQAIGRLRQLPGHSWDGETIHFAPSLRAELLDRWGDTQKQSKIAQKLSQQFDKVGRTLPDKSIAQLVAQSLALYLLLENPSATLTRTEIDALVRLIGPAGPLRDFIPSNQKYRRHNNPLRRYPQEFAEKLATIWPNVVEQRELPEDIVVIPGGQFLMGDSTGEGYADERPAHEVEVSEFGLGRHPVTNREWQTVRNWAIGHGYDLKTEGDPSKPDHPVGSVSWYDAVRWCNARSEMEQRRPAYYLRSGFEPEAVLRQGDVDVHAEWVDWESDGYRLPTEAEWERAARGGKDGHHYPWNSKGKGFEKFITRANANFNRHENGTTAVDKYPANEFGLHDMSGNVWEWCWDWKDDRWYKQQEATLPNNRGPVEGALRVIRGGCWNNVAGFARCAYRIGSHPSYAFSDLGFRLSLGAAGLGLKAGPTGARRGDERKETRIQAEPKPRGALLVQVPDLANVRLLSRSLAGELTRSPGRPEAWEVGRWTIRCEADGFQPTEVEVEIKEGEAREVSITLEREAPPDFEWIPAGRFAMGDPTDEGWADERPRHPVFVSEFWMAKYPVTNQEWHEVCEWAARHGYHFKAKGDIQKPRHPLVDVDWFDAARWCNARSEREGRRPVYYVGADRKPESVYRSGSVAIENASVDWAADGYRLPTEAEWEKAARGGKAGHQYPWDSRGPGHANWINRELANYGGNEGGTTPVDRYTPNGYGLHAMAGNVWEWCWDRWDQKWYENPGASKGDPVGPFAGASRVIRGGCWNFDARGARCAFRSGLHPSNAGSNRGFRLSLGHLGRVEPVAGGREARRDDEPLDYPTTGSAQAQMQARNSDKKKSGLWGWFGFGSRSRP